MITDLDVEQGHSNAVDMSPWSFFNVSLELLPSQLLSVEVSVSGKQKERGVYNKTSIDLHETNKSIKFKELARQQIYSETPENIMYQY